MQDSEVGRLTKMVSKKDGWSRDVLLQPYQLKHLTLKNRIMTTSHEPAYPEDGMPKERYRAYLRYALKLVLP